MTVRTERLVRSRGHQYRQLVEHYWDPLAKRTRTHFLKSLGPVTPIYPRAPPVAPTVLPLEPPHFGFLATRIMTGTLTLAHIVQAVHDMGEEMPPGDLAAVGIRFDLDVKKTPRLEFLLWPALPSSRPRPARSARRPLRSKDDANPPPSSPSMVRHR